MRRKYEITITTTLASPRGEVSDGGVWGGWVQEEKEIGEKKKNAVLLEKMENREKSRCEDNGG